jgi:hypothetical protein
MPYDIASFNDSSYTQPNFTIVNPINVPESIWRDIPNKKEFPITVSISISTQMPRLEFDVLLISNEVLN